MDAITSRLRSIPTWAVLAICCAAQFMVVLDVAIVNVALPQMRESLGLSVAGEQWVVNAYTLTFAGFLMLGGRAADLFGRRRIFIIGLTVFTVCSLIGGTGPERCLVDHRPGRPGNRRSHPGPGNPQHPGHDLHRPRRTSAGPRRLVGHGGQRGGGRRAGRGHPDQPARLAVGPLRQRAHRHRAAGRSLGGAPPQRGAGSAARHST